MTRRDYCELVDISTTEVAEARTGFSLVSNLRNTEKEMTNKVPMLKTMTRPADLGATGEVLTSTKTLKRRREGGDDVKTSLDKGHALDQPKRVKTARSEDTSSFLKGKVRQATSQLLFNWLQAKVGPEDAEKRWMETHKTGKAEASLFKVEYTKLYKQHGSMMRKVNTWLDAKRKPVDTLRELKPNQKTLEGALNGEYYNYYVKKLKES